MGALHDILVRRRPREDDPGWNPYTMGNRHPGPSRAGPAGLVGPPRGPSTYPADHTVLIPRAHDIRQFQSFHGLSVTGNMDHATRRKMRQVNTTAARGAFGYGGHG